MTVLTVASVVVAALLGLIGVLVGQLYARISKLETSVRTGQDYNRRLWLWARQHLDLYYRHRRDGAPDPAPIPSEDDES